MDIGLIFQREYIMNVRIYCRASTEGQHADRALVSLREFAQSKNWLPENTLRMQVVRSWIVLNSCIYWKAQPGDLLLIEAIDRLSRLQHEEWAELKATLNSKGLVIVSMDLPTSWQMVEMSGNDLTSGILRAVNSMLIDILATMARQDYETRRKRQAQGIERAKQAGLYTGKKKIWKPVRLFAKCWRRTLNQPT
jgi:DNA invertase Pin-like site-specific DNA recombinase